MTAGLATQPDAAGVSKIRVILAIEEYYSVFGGVERTVSRLAWGLSERGHEVILLTFEDPGQYEPFHSLPAGVRCVDLGLTGNLVRRQSLFREALRKRLPAFMVAALRNVTAITRAFRVRRQEVPVLTQALERLAPDVVISFKTHLHRYMIPAGQNAGVPVIASEHNPPSVLYGHYLSPVDRYLTLRLLPRAARVRVLLDGFSVGYPETVRPLCREVPNGVSIPETAAQTGCRERCVVLNVGRLDPQKGQDLLIRAFARLAPEHPNWVLRIVGEGARRGELESLVAELGIEGCVELPGETRDVWSQYQAAALFAMSSPFEGFGNVTAEAMATGLPVVGFEDCEETNALLAHGHTGLLVSADDRVARLAEGLERLMREPGLRAQIGATARESMRARRIERATDGWERLLHEVVTPAGEQQLRPVRNVTQRRVGLYLFSVAGAGGAEYQILRLAGALLARGYEVHLITLDAEEAEAFHGLPDGVVWHRLGWRRTLAGKLKRVRVLRRLVQRLELGVFVGYIMGADKTIYAALVGTGTPLVAAERNDPVIYHRDFGMVRRTLYWLLFCLCSRIAIQLDCYRDRYPRFLRRRIETIGNPLRTACLTVRHKDHEQTQASTILNVGRLDWQKGQDLLLEAFAHSGLAKRGWRLRVVGSGASVGQDLAARSEELGVAKSVEWSRPTATVEREYAAADVFAFPSRHEGFPNALAEAMAAGMPCIALRDCLGAAAFITHEHSGVLVSGVTREDRVRGLADALVRLCLDGELRQHLGQRAAEVAQVYAGDAVFDRWDDLLGRLTEPSSVESN